MITMGVPIVCLIAALAIHVVPVRPLLNLDESAELFEQFRVKYGKTYNSHDVVNRFKIFKHNLLRINAQQNQEQGSAVYGITEFADLTEEEFAVQYTNSLFEMPSDSERYDITAEDLGKPPASSDWRPAGVVGPVQDQGGCHASWAFSVVGNIEAMWAMKTKQFNQMSTQHLINCDSVNDGCNGGYPIKAYDTVNQVGGLAPDSACEYVGYKDECSHYSPSYRINASIVLGTSEDYLTSWLTKKGPISVALNGDQLQFYFGGISHPRVCDPRGINHGALLIGHGEEQGIPYWIVKNSWGTRWGEQGYFRIYRGDGTCGINLMCSSAIVL